MSKTVKSFSLWHKPTVHYIKGYLTKNIKLTNTSDLFANNSAN